MRGAHVERLKLRARERRLEVHAVRERFDFDVGDGGRRQLALRTLRSRVQTADGALRERGVAILLDETLREELDDVRVEVLTPQARVSTGGVHLEDAALD